MLPLPERNKNHAAVVLDVLFPVADDMKNKNQLSSASELISFLEL